jgi:haloalkane dehalogenase
VAGFAGEYPFTSHWLEVAGQRLHYVDEGEGEVVLMVHGNPTWSFYWRHLIRGLCERYRCIALDHLGCGRSDKPAHWPYRLAGHIDNLGELVTRLDLERVTLCVHDWGGPIGLGVARREPERFARYVITNTAAFHGVRAPWRIRACRTPGLGALAVRGLNAFARAATFMAVADHARMTPAVRRGYLAPYDSFETRIATLRFVQDIPLVPSHPSWDTLSEIEAFLPALREQPVALAWGERDWCFTPRVRREWQRRLPHAEALVCEAAGHYLLEDAHDDVVPFIRAFLARHPLTP